MSIGVIVRRGRVLIGRRPAGGRLAGFWEFPGGKLLPGEPPDQGLLRELQEELGVVIHIATTLPPLIHRDPDLAVRIHPFLCRLADEQQEPIPLANDELRWVSPAELPDYRFPPANAPLLRQIAGMDLSQAAAQPSPSRFSSASGRRT